MTRMDMESIISTVFSIRGIVLSTSKSIKSSTCSAGNNNGNPEKQKTSSTPSFYSNTNAARSAPL